MNCNRCTKCCKTSYLIFHRTKILETLKKYHLPLREYIPRLSNYGSFYVSWGDCPFLSNASCIIYDDRPVACQVYPIVVDDTGYPRLETDCPCYETITENDLERVKGLLDTERLNVKREAALWISKHSYENLHNLFEQFTRDLAEFGKRTTSVCFWIDAVQFLQQKKVMKDAD